MKIPYPIKIRLRKSYPISSNWTRFRDVEKFVLEPNGPIQTEAEFCYYIYSRYGPGRYQAFAYQLKVKGLWTFWLGNIYDNGFMRDLKKDNEIDDLKKELRQPGLSHDDRESIEDDINLSREIKQEESKMKRRGPTSLIKYKPGILHAFDELPKN